MTTNGKRIKRLMKKDPHCHWCKIEVIYPYPPPVILPDDFATIDHLYSRKKKEMRLRAMLEAKRRNDGAGIYYVLACRKCNNRRGARGD